MPTPKQVLADPNFYQLPEAEQQKVLARIDPSFGSLPASERTKVLQMGKSRLAQSPSDTASLHAKAGYSTTQGTPQEEPTFGSRLAESTGVPTSWKQVGQMFTMTPQQAKDTLIAGPMGPTLMNAGRRAAMDYAMGRPPVDVGTKLILEGPLAPVGGQAVSNIAEDLPKGRLGAAGGDIAGTILNLLALRYNRPSTAERLVAATNSAPKYIRMAIPDLEAEVSRSGRPSGARPVDVLGDRIGAAERALNQEYANSAGPYGHTTLPLSPQGTFPISDRILALITPNMDETAAGTAAKKAIVARAAEFQKPWTLGNLDHERIAANARLNAFEKKGETGQYAAEGSSVGTAIDKAIATGIRDTAYPRLDQLTGKPQGYHAALKKRIGALMNMSSDLKDNAEATEKQSMKVAGGGNTNIPKVRGVIGHHGQPHLYLSEQMQGSDPFKTVNKAARKAFPGRAQKTLDALQKGYVYSYPAREEARQRAQRLVQALAQQGAQ